MRASDPTPSPPPRPRAGSRGPMASLHDAAERGDVPRVQAGLQAGVNPDLREGDEYTALHRAAQYGHVAVVGALVGGGAAVGAVTKSGKTALHFAAYNGHAAVVGALAGAGADADAATKDGHTPLSAAACNGKTEAAAALLGAGADATRPDNKGKTAAEWARQKGKAAVAKLIEDHLAAPKAAAQKKAPPKKAASAVAKPAAIPLGWAVKALGRPPALAAPLSAAAAAAALCMVPEPEPEPEPAPRSGGSELVDATRDETGAVADLLRESMPDATVVRVQRNNHPRLYKKYVANREDVEGQAVFKHERWLWNGNDSIQEQISGGFDIRYASQEFNKYGVGVYFAADARLSAFFERSTRAEHGEKKLILARVALGESHDLLLAK
eukprot:COSAG01_NODE_2631_length_7340_cov_35.191686_8_plen_383_part_00